MPQFSPGTQDNLHGKGQQAADRRTTPVPRSPPQTMAYTIMYFQFFDVKPGLKSTFHKTTLACGGTPITSKKLILHRRRPAGNSGLSKCRRAASGYSDTTCKFCLEGPG